MIVVKNGKIEKYDVDASKGIAEYNPAIGIVYREMTDEEISSISSRDVSAEINELKQKLSDTDYIACKIAEGSATVEEYAEQIKQRQLWREQINELEMVKNEVI